MQTQQKRSMQVDFPRQRLHSSIAGALRRKGIPNDLRGYDLVRGVVFGMMDHPEYSMEAALERAMERTSVPGAPRDMQEAYECLWECVEPALREADFHEDRDHSKRRMSNLETANAFIQRILREVRKDYCYSSTIQFMREKNFNNYFAYDTMHSYVAKCVEEIYAKKQEG